MKYTDHLRTGIDSVRSYATSERVKKHGAVASAIGRTCSALLEVVTEEHNPQAHKVIRSIGRVANIAAIASSTTSEIADVFKAPEVPSDATENVADVVAQSELPASQQAAGEPNASLQPVPSEVPPLTAGPTA